MGRTTGSRNRLKAACEPADAPAAPAPVRPMLLHRLGDAHVGPRMATRRQAIGLSARDLAATLGLSYQQVRNYELGLDRIKARHLPTLAAALGVDVDWLFGGLPGVRPSELEPLAASGPGVVLLDALGRITDREMIATLGRLAKHLSGQSVTRRK